MMSSENLEVAPVGRLLRSSVFLWFSFVTLLAQYCYVELAGDPGSKE